MTAMKISTILYVYMSWIMFRISGKLYNNNNNQEHHECHEFHAYSKNHKNHAREKIMKNINLSIIIENERKNLLENYDNIINVMKK